MSLNHLDTTIKQIQAAIKANDEQTALRLIDNVADALKAAVGNKNRPIDTLAWQAAESGAALVVDKLIDLGVSPDLQDGVRFNAGWQYEGTTILMTSVNHNREAVINTLLRRHANANLGDSDGKKPLHIASSNHRMKIAASLLDQGEEDPNLGDNAHTLPIQWAHYQPDMVELLVSHGAYDKEHPPTIEQLTHMTPKQRASYEETKNAVEHLVKAGRTNGF
jgi:ankyrin repeat protein